ncbi:MAG: Tfp pilus assembly protein FimT/FimU [Caldimicrobium sp.]
MKQAGFTLIELLIVILMIGMVYSLILPYSQSLLEKYQALRKAEEVKAYFLKKRAEAFLYGDKIELINRDGKIVASNNETFSLDRGKILMEAPIVFYPLGTTNGGVVRIVFSSITIELEIVPPFGEVKGQI